MKQPDYLRVAQRATEQLRQTTRHAEVLERQLRKLMDAQGGASETVDIAEELPSFGGPTLRDESSYAAPDPRLAPGRETARFWPSRRPSAPALKPSKGPAHATVDISDQHVVGFSVIGLNRDTLEVALDRIDRHLSEVGGYTPVFLYDGFDFDLFRRRGWVLEWLPPEEDRKRAPGTSAWSDFLAERIELLRRKWGMIDLQSVEPEHVGLGAPLQEAGGDLAATPISSENSAPSTEGTTTATICSFVSGRVSQGVNDEPASWIAAG